MTEADYDFGATSFRIGFISTYLMIFLPHSHSRISTAPQFLMGNRLGRIDVQPTEFEANNQLNLYFFLYITPIALLISRYE
jgi:hypothetical protein